MLRILKFLFTLYRFHKNGSDENADYLIKNAKICGTVAIKLLQFICMRSNIKNNKLNSLFENCDIHTIEQTKRMYLQDFGKRLEADFAVANAKVIGSGSIGQVYRFYSRRHRRYVALKSKHPDIDENVHKFIKSIKVISWFIRPFNMYHELITEYLNNITHQLDYAEEAANTKHFKLLWKDESCIVIPDVYYSSKNFICMSFHDGKNFNELTDKQQVMASVYLNFICLTGLLVHDFTHVDLHIGNWKVNTDNFKIVVYDCGIMCKTGNLTTNKEISLQFLAGRVDKLVHIICNGKQDHLDKVSKFIKNNLPETAMEKTQFFIHTVLKERIVTNKAYIDILTALGVVSQISDKSAGIFTKYIGTDYYLYECLIYIYISLMERLQTFVSLKTFLKEFIDSDPLHKTRYQGWMMERFGHSKESILHNIIYDKIRLQ